LAGYLLTLVTSTHYHVDLIGTAAFALAALPALKKSTNIRIRWSGTAMATWGCKLATFLFWRVIDKGGQDSRLTEILESPYYAAGFWTFSLFWGVLCSLPHTLGTTSSALGNPVARKAGAALFTAGIFTETLADYQKWSWKQGHPGEYCHAGLWSISQHPNWFGNLVLWVGIFVMNANALVEPASKAMTPMQHLWRYRRAGFALLGPMFISYLFYGQATGRLLADSLEATHKRYGYGKDEGYTSYVDNTPLVIPNPLKWFTE
jgi:steroid 5-alpha reductase family enzyme